ncbi:MAG: hypothetical protein GY832_28160 [Chloroflexi bacterium]|nr:hypothetical protein [Chloroflexota bacterium]
MMSAGFVWIILLVLAALVLAVARLYGRATRKVVSELQILNSEGRTGTALVVYSAGLGESLAKASRAFAEGLVSDGWRVEMTTASAEAPADLSGYDLLVLGAHTYFWTPDRVIQQYLGRLGDLAGQRTVVIVTALGQGERSTGILKKRIQEASGDVIKTLILYTMRPNEDLYGINDAEEIATRESRALQLVSEGV